MLKAGYAEDWQYHETVSGTRKAAAGDDTRSRADERVSGAAATSVGC
jgi:hypothetical protein